MRVELTGARCLFGWRGRVEIRGGGRRVEGEEGPGNSKVRGYAAPRDGRRGSLQWSGVDPKTGRQTDRQCDENLGRKHGRDGLRVTTTHDKSECCTNPK